MNNIKPKVLFLCSFSSRIVREKLRLKKWKVRNAIMRFVKHPVFNHLDKGVWVSDFIQEFEKHPEYEYHILSFHIGMIQNEQRFEINGIHYHFLKLDSNLVCDTLNAKFKIAERLDYKSHRQRIKKLIDEIKPDIVVLCGAENPEYSSAVLDVDNHPIYVLLQTVLNNPRLAQYTKEAGGYRAEVEKRIFQKVRYFGTNGIGYYSLYHNINPEAQCLKVKFPSHQPPILNEVDKIYDFVFFGRMTKNKGIDDVVKAMAKLVKDFPDASLCMIGSAPVDLMALVNEFGINNNVMFIPRIELLDDLYAEVQKARVVVLPGITAFNSTVREAMLMSMPTIVYELPVVKKINEQKQCLLSAKMEDVNDLYEQMKFSLNHPDRVKEIAANGKEYASLHYNNEEIGNQLSANFCAIINNYYKGTPVPNELLLSDGNK